MVGIVNSLRLKLGRGRRRYETSAEAYDLYLRAHSLEIQGGLSGWNQSIGPFEEVIVKDPLFAPAYAALAAAHAARSGQSDFDLADEMSKMRGMAEKAIQLDPLLAEAHDTLGLVYAREAQWERSEKSFRRAIELDPIRDNRTPELASTLGRYASAVALVGGAAISKVVFFPALERHLPFTFFYSAIVATSWVAGTAPGLLATGLSAACVYYLFSGSTAETSPGNPGLLLFGLEATGICLLTGTFRQRLVETEAHLGRVFEDSPLGTLIIEGGAQILKANPAFRQILRADKVRLEVTIKAIQEFTAKMTALRKNSRRTTTIHYAELEY